MTEPPADPPVPEPERADAATGGQEMMSSPNESSATQRPTYVYALGRVQPRFPSISIEKEFSQAVARSDTSGQTNRQVVAAGLADHRYLARQMCWVFTIEGLETYLLYARDTADLDLLIQAVRAEPTGQDVDMVIGTQGPIAPQGPGKVVHAV